MLTRVNFEIDRIFGLPAHPLFAHAPVVLVPLVAIGAVACAWSRRARQRLGWIVVGIALVTVVSVQLAISSGQALEESVRESRLVDDHAAVSDTLLPLAAVLFVAVTAMVGADHAARRRGSRGRAAVAVFAVATVAAAALSTVWVVRAGHTGATAVWDDPHRPLLVEEADE